MGEPQGHYETVGDVHEWVWDEGHEPEVKVPRGEFDPRDPKPEPEAKPKPKAAAKK
jgi:hypothetical protein